MSRRRTLEKRVNRIQGPEGDSEKSEKFKEEADMLWLLCHLTKAEQFILAHLLVGAPQAVQPFSQLRYLLSWLDPAYLFVLGSNPPKPEIPGTREAIIQTINEGSKRAAKQPIERRCEFKERYLRYCANRTLGPDHTWLENHSCWRDGQLSERPWRPGEYEAVYSQFHPEHIQSQAERRDRNQMR